MRMSFDKFLLQKIPEIDQFLYLGGADLPGQTVRLKSESYNHEIDTYFCIYAGTF